MKIGLIALGTRGDVQPYVALGAGLQQAGHEVVLVSHGNFRSFVEGYGLAFWPTEGNIEEILQREEVRELLASGNFIKITQYTAKEGKKAALQWASDGLAACRDVDLLIAGLGGLYIGIALGEKLNVPVVPAYLVPFTPTRTLPNPLVPPALAKSGLPINWLSHHLARQFMWQGSRGGDKAARTEILGLSAAPFFGPYNSPALAHGRVLYGFSPSVIPKPADWGEKKHVTGYWFLDSQEEWSPPPHLAQFLADGPRPVYIGFGSMSSENPEETTRMIIEAVVRSGQRAVLLSGWGGMADVDLPDTVCMVKSVPHDWLFPQMAAVVHHGGAGTTAAGLRAGVPGIVVANSADQPFWGQRLVDLGVSPGWIPRKALTAETLAEAVQKAATDGSIQQTAQVLGGKIRAEDGISEAVKLLEKMVGEKVMA